MKIKSVGIIGKRWFDRRAGNTYNNVAIYVNGRRVAVLGMSYGYGNMYEQRAVKWLLDEYKLKGEPYYGLRRLGEENAFETDVEVIDVPRKRDLE
jgi:hypothetical protein